MRGTNHLLALTTEVDDITGDIIPLFSFPVQVCKATDDGGEIRFDGAAPSGAEYKTQYVDESTGEVFEYGDRIRGIRVGDEFKAIDEDAIKAIDDATKLTTMFALGRVDLDEALAKYGSRITSVHFLQSPAKGGSPKAYRLTYEALREQKSGKKVTQKAQAIVTKRTARSRQKLGLIYADEANGCLALLEVQFAAKMREPDAQVLAPQTAEVSDEQVEMARTAINALPDGDLPLDNEVDEAVALRQDLIERAIAGEAIEAPAKTVAEATADDDLTAVLEASIAAAAAA